MYVRVSNSNVCTKFELFYEDALTYSVMAWLAKSHKILLEFVSKFSFCDHSPIKIEIFFYEIFFYWMVTNSEKVV